jgi:hypothetical protein
MARGAEMAVEKPVLTAKHPKYAKMPHFIIHPSAFIIPPRSAVGAACL